MSPILGSSLRISCKVEEKFLKTITYMNTLLEIASHGHVAVNPDSCHFSSKVNGNVDSSSH
jgi:hypothetical protein